MHVDVCIYIHTMVEECFYLLALFERLALEVAYLMAIMASGEKI